jgi:hypothetical protein
MRMDDLSSCRNCLTPFDSEERYCPHCGTKAPARMRMSNLTAMVLHASAAVFCVLAGLLSVAFGVAGTCDGLYFGKDGTKEFLAMVGLGLASVVLFFIGRRLDRRVNRGP